MRESWLRRHHVYTTFIRRELGSLSRRALAGGLRGRAAAPSRLRLPGGWPGGARRPWRGIVDPFTSDCVPAESVLPTHVQDAAANGLEIRTSPIRQPQSGSYWHSQRRCARRACPFYLTPTTETLVSCDCTLCVCLPAWASTYRPHHTNDNQRRYPSRRVAVGLLLSSSTSWSGWATGESSAAREPCDLQLRGVQHVLS